MSTLENGQSFSEWSEVFVSQLEYGYLLELIRREIFSKDPAQRLRLKHIIEREKYRMTKEVIVYQSLADMDIDEKLLQPPKPEEEKSDQEKEQLKRLDDEDLDLWNVTFGFGI